MLVLETKGSIVFDMTDSIKFELPDSYSLTILEINGVAVENLARPPSATDNDLLRVHIQPIHRDPVLGKGDDLYVTLPELREMQDAANKNRLLLVAELSGEPGISARDVKLGRQLLEKIQREQLKRRKNTLGA